MMQVLSKRKPVEVPAPSIFQTHDHANCQSDILTLADQQAQAGELRLTAVRRRVLELLLESHQALGAYEILEKLARDGFGDQPPVAYRALNFLVQQGFAHKVRRLNAYMACTQPLQSHQPVLLICRQCKSVAETAAPVAEAVHSVAGEVGFEVERMNLEAIGLCPACAGGGSE